MAGKGDLVFEVEGKVIHCRRRALMARSAYLNEYLKKNNCSKICVSNVSHEACATVLGWMQDQRPLATLVPEDYPLVKLQKVWELSLRFTVPELVQHCMGLLEERMDANNVCGFISTLIRYPSLPPEVLALNSEFKKRCFDFLVDRYADVQQTPSFFAMMGVSAKIKAEVEAALAERKAPALRSRTSERGHRLGQGQPADDDRKKSRRQGGTATLLSKLKEQPSQPLPHLGADRDASPMSAYHSLPNTPRGHSSSTAFAGAAAPPHVVTPALSRGASPFEAQFAAHSTGAAAGAAPQTSFQSVSSIPQRSNTSMTPSHAPADAIHEPVYEAGPVFHTDPGEAAGDAVYDYPQPRSSHGAAATRHKPAPSPMRGAPGGYNAANPSRTHSSSNIRTSSATSRVFDELHKAGMGSGSLPAQDRRLSSNAASDGNRSPTPQPPALTSAEGLVQLEVEAAGGALQPGCRLATCVEAHAQRKLLRELMDGIDGGFLGSFELEDGKVDGPGFGVPLRFATGTFGTVCSLRVVVRCDPTVLPAHGRSAFQPHSQLHTSVASSGAGYPAGYPENRVPSPSPMSRNDAVAAAAQPNASFDTERDSLVLKHYKLQQEVRVMSHELELFKCDYQDWEVSLNETNALRDVEERKLRERIMQQKRQLVNCVYSDLQNLNEGMADDAAESDERAELRKRLDALKTKPKDSKRLQAIRAEVEKAKADIQKLGHVKGLIETELAENEQYEEYSKRYVCAVKSAEKELTAVLAHQDNHNADSIRAVLETVAGQKRDGEREVGDLDRSTQRLRNQIEHECHHIRHIRAFLDETEPQRPLRGVCG